MVITLDELRIIANKQKFDPILLEKDYLLTYLLYLIHDVKGIYFKGGTALNKLFLNHQRLSEDIDFTLTKSLPDVEKEIKEKLKGTIFEKIEEGKKVEGFTRLIAHYMLFHEKGTIFIDLNQKAKMLLKPKSLKVPHFYKKHIPQFEVKCLHEKEIIAEKVMATSERYKPRDYFDLYYIIKRDLPVSMNLIRNKFKAVGKRFNAYSLFKNTHRIFNEWNDDLFMLTKSRPDFKTVMKTIKKKFKYRK